MKLSRVGIDDNRGAHSHSHSAVHDSCPLMYRVSLLHLHDSPPAFCNHTKYKTFNFIFTTKVMSWSIFYNFEMLDFDYDYINLSKRKTSSQYVKTLLKQLFSR